MYEANFSDLFFLNPMKKFGVRELSRITKTDTKTVMKYLKNLVKRKIILKKKEKKKYPYYEANRLSNLYRHEKSEVLIRKVLESGLIEFLEEKLTPKTIVLFGSVQKGTYHQESDVDLFIQTDYKKIDLSKFDKKIGYKVKLFFEKDLNKLSEGLLENIYNGLTLSGKLEVFKWEEKILQDVLKKENYLRQG